MNAFITQYTDIINACPDLSSVALLLKKGKSRIEEGWCQGYFEKAWRPAFVADDAPRWRMCALGGLMYAERDPDDRYPRYKDPLDNSTHAVAKAALSLVAWEHHGHGVVEYNDRPGTTQADVVHLYDLAIQRIELWERDDGR